MVDSQNEGPQSRPQIPYFSLLGLQKGTLVFGEPHMNRQSRSCMLILILQLVNVRVEASVRSSGVSSYCTCNGESLHLNQQNQILQVLQVRGSFTYLSNQEGSYA